MVTDSCPRDWGEPLFIELRTVQALLVTDSCPRDWGEPLFIELRNGEGGDVLFKHISELFCGITITEPLN